MLQKQERCVRMSQCRESPNNTRCLENADGRDMLTDYRVVRVGD